MDPVRRKDLDDDSRKKKRATVAPRTPATLQVGSFLKDAQARQAMLESAKELPDAANRGFVTNLAGGPVDLANTLMHGAGGDKPFGGSAWFGDFLQKYGMMKPESSTPSGKVTETAAGMLTPGGLLKGALGAASFIGKAPKGVTTIAKTGKVVPAGDELVAMHNISPEGLWYAQKKTDGKVLVPSIAAAKVNSPLEGFGDTHLIGWPSILDPQGKYNTPVLSADGYTMRFPKVRDALMTKDEKERLLNWISPVLDVNNPAEASRFLDSVYMRSGVGPDMSGSHDIVRKFLHEKGALPKQMTADDIRAANREKWGREDTTHYDPYEVHQHNRNRNIGELSMYNNGEWYDWLEAQKGLYQPSGEFKSGQKLKWDINPYGERRSEWVDTYSPATVDNIVKHMSSGSLRGAEGGGGINGLHRLRALASSQFRTMHGIQTTGRDRIVPRNEMNLDFNQARMDLDNVAMMPGYNKGYGFASDTGYDLVKAFGAGKPDIKTLYARHPELANNPESYEAGKKWVGQLKGIGTGYLEGKPKHALQIGENFPVAIVQHDAEAQHVNRLRDLGVQDVIRMGPGDKASEVMQNDERIRKLLFSLGLGTVGAAAAGSGTGLFDQPEY